MVVDSEQTTYLVRNWAKNQAQTIPISNVVQSHVGTKATNEITSSPYIVAHINFSQIPRV